MESVRAVPCQEDRRMGESTRPRRHRRSGRSVRWPGEGLTSTGIQSSTIERGGEYRRYSPLPPTQLSEVLSQKPRVSIWAAVSVGLN